MANLADTLIGFSMALIGLPVVVAAPVHFGTSAIIVPFSRSSIRVSGPVARFAYRNSSDPGTPATPEQRHGAQNLPMIASAESVMLRIKPDVFH